MPRNFVLDEKAPAFSLTPIHNQTMIRWHSRFNEEATIKLMNRYFPDNSEITIAGDKSVTRMVNHLAETLEGRPCVIHLRFVPSLIKDSPVTFSVMKRGDTETISPVHLTGNNSSFLCDETAGSVLNVQSSRSLLAYASLCTYAHIVQKKRIIMPDTIPVITIAGMVQLMLLHGQGIELE